MAQGLPNNLYSGYAQVFDSRPSINFAARLLAQRQAKQDALDKYFMDAASKVTSAGMRETEVPMLFKARDNFMKFAIENKRQLRDGNPDAWIKANELKNTMLSIPETSKGAKGASDNVRSLYLTHPDIVRRMNEEKDLPLIDAHEQPTHTVDEKGNVIPNPNHVPLDPSKMSFNAKTYTVKDLDAHVARRNQLFPMDGQRVETRPNPDDQFSQIQETVSFYSPKKLNAIAQWEKNDYKQDESMQQTFKEGHDLIKTPVEEWKIDHMDEFDKYNNVYKAVTGQDIVDDADMFAASQLLPLVDQISVKQKTQPAFAARANYNDKLIRSRMNLSQGYKTALIDYRLAKTKEEEEGVLNQFIKNSYEAGTDRNNKKTIEKITIDGKQYTGRFIDVPKEIAKDFVVPKIGKDGKPVVENGNYVPLTPDGFYLTDDKTTFIPIYLGSKTAQGGNYILPQSKPMDIQFYKTPLSKLLLSKAHAGSEVVDEFAGDGKGGFVPAINSETKEVHKEIKSERSTKAKDPLGLF